MTQALIIDQEFRDLIPPPSAQEIENLEEKILNLKVGESSKEAEKILKSIEKLEASTDDDDAKAYIKALARKTKKFL